MSFHRRLIPDNVICTALDHPAAQIVRLSIVDGHRNHRRSRPGGRPSLGLVEPSPRRRFLDSISHTWHRRFCRRGKWGLFIIDRYGFVKVTLELFPTGCPNGRTHFPLLLLMNAINRKAADDSIRLTVLRQEVSNERFFGQAMISK